MRLEVAKMKNLLLALDSLFTTMEFSQEKVLISKCMEYEKSFEFTSSSSTAFTLEKELTCAREYYALPLFSAVTLEETTRSRPSEFVLVCPVVHRWEHVDE